jgi:hypothetical protein
MTASDLRSNRRINAPHSAITPRAYCSTRLARGRARYAAR